MTKAFLFALFAASFTAAAAHADTVTLTLNPSTVSTAPGITATYTATISAPTSNAAPVFLNGDSITFADPTDITLDDSGLIANFPALLDPGDSNTETLFTLKVPASELTGSYLGYYVLQGGADEDAQDTLTTQQFTLDVNASTASSVTPEPSSYVLLSTGMLATLGLALRKRLADGAQL